MVVMTCCAIASTSSARSTSASAAKGLNESGSTPSGKPNTRAISATSKSPSCASVVKGVTTVAPAGADNLMPDKTDPELVSIVESSVVTTIGASGFVDAKE